MNNDNNIYTQFGEICERYKLENYGTCDFHSLKMSEYTTQKLLQLCPTVNGVFTIAFPYWNENYKNGNISVYARGLDYHIVIKKILQQISQELRQIYSNNIFIEGVDNFPLNERECAILSGIGLVGQNGLIIVPPYGSYVFLGNIITDMPLKNNDKPSKNCMNCGKCKQACPGGALRLPVFDENYCLSSITQKKGELSEDEIRLIKKHNLIWGCDICQSVCPYNQNVKSTNIAEFYDNIEYMPTLDSSDLEGLSNKQFKLKYGNRAFAWRGSAVLKRNIKIQNEEAGE